MSECWDPSQLAIHCFVPVALQIGRNLDKVLDLTVNQGVGIELRRVDTPRRLLVYLGRLPHPMVALGDVLVCLAFSIQAREARNNTSKLSSSFADVEGFRRTRSSPAGL